MHVSSTSHPVPPVKSPPATNEQSQRRSDEPQPDKPAHARPHSHHHMGKHVDKTA